MKTKIKPKINQKPAEKKRKEKIFVCVIIALLLFNLLLAGLAIERKIYAEFNAKWPGDCGHFVVWATSLFHEKKISPAQITYQISPWVVVTGPITIKEELAKLDINSTFYNNFSISQIKQRINENKIVIIMINLNSTKISTGAGATHYIFIYKYNDTGLFFTDSYYWLNRYQSEGMLQSYFMEYGEIENRWQNIMQPGQFVGKIENAIGLSHFAIVPDESNPENLNKKIKFVFYTQHAAEGVIEAIGRFIAALSPRIQKP